jgi:hypothetical protein
MKVTRLSFFSRIYNTLSMAPCGMPSNTISGKQMPSWWVKEIGLKAKTTGAITSNAAK